MSASPPSFLHSLKRLSLVTQIVIGLIAGIALALLAPEVAKSTTFIGKVFVSALKAVAPILVFVLVMASIANHKHGQETHIRPILVLYLLGTFAAAVVAVIASSFRPGAVDPRRGHQRARRDHRSAAKPAAERGGQPGQRPDERQLHRHPGLGHWHGRGHPSCRRDHPHRAR